ncbi:MAG: LysM peptidoglycan-binding domain-containing protein, partial [Pseudomonadota bacterium]
VQIPGQEEAASSSDQATEESTSAGNDGGAVETTQDGTSTNESTSLASNTSGSEKQNQTGTAGSSEVETPTSDEPTTTEVASLANENEQTTSDADPVETVAKKELRTGTAVIIRRGDSLWRVARRNYGKGIRYTTIFEANRDQVRDADLIYPGQVLKVPELEEETASE